jgi:hypothetical protein
MCKRSPIPLLDGSCICAQTFANYVVKARRLVQYNKITIARCLALLEKIPSDCKRDLLQWRFNNILQMIRNRSDVSVYDVDEGIFILVCMLVRAHQMKKNVIDIITAWEEGNLKLYFPKRLWEEYRIDN